MAGDRAGQRRWSYLLLEASLIFLSGFLGLERLLLEEYDAAMGRFGARVGSD